MDTRAIVERQYRGVVENLERVRALSRDRSRIPNRHEQCLDHAHDGRRHAPVRLIA